MSDCCWISTLEQGGGGDFRWGTTVALKKRADTGKMNVSPKTAALPIRRITHGCETVLTIPMTDPDGDILRCRWATGREECGDVCRAVPGATLQAVSNCCTLYHV